MLVLNSHNIWCTKSKIKTTMTIIILQPFVTEIPPTPHPPPPPLQGQNIWGQHGIRGGGHPGHPVPDVRWGNHPVHAAPGHHVWHATRHLHHWQTQLLSCLHTGMHGFYSFFMFKTYCEWTWEFKENCAQFYLMHISGGHALSSAS